MLFLHTTGNSTPHDPKFHPDGLLFMKRHAMREDGSGLLASPFIERVAETGAQRVARKLKPNALVISRSAPPACSCMQRAPQLTQQRHTPLLARPQRLLQTTPRLLDFAGNRDGSRGCCFAAEDLLDLPASFSELRGHRFNDRAPGRCRRAS